MTRSYAPEVQTAGNGDSWSGNGVRFAMQRDAESWVADLSIRWTAVTNTRVVESDDEPTR